MGRARARTRTRTRGNVLDADGLHAVLAAFMDSHLTSQSSTIFRSVHSLIYIFDAESPELGGSDTHYFLKCLGALKDQNGDGYMDAKSGASLTASDAQDGSSVGGPTVFVLLHKMDLVS